MTRRGFALPWLLLILCSGSAAVAQEKADGAAPPSATAPEAGTVPDEER